MGNPGERKSRILGACRLAVNTISLPPEREAIAVLQAQKGYHGWQAVEEARSLGLLRPTIRHVELSPTFRCPEDCQGCPDRISLHLNDPPEKQIPLKQWFQTVNRLIEFGVEYFLLIGGTIDRHPVTSRLASFILDKEAPADIGWFTDGIMLQDFRTGQLTPLFYRLIEEGRILQATTHVSADYLVNQGIALNGPLLSPKDRWDNQPGGSRRYKSAFGLRLARQLVEKEAKRIVLNTAVMPGNLNEVIPVYEYVKELQDYARQIGSPTVVLHTLSPWTWRPHLARGDNPGNFSVLDQLGLSHTMTLKNISRHILVDTWDRQNQGLPRVTANSSGYLVGLADFAISQDVPHLELSGELAVQPDGAVRMDPIFISAQMLGHAKNPYGYRDRDVDCPPFDSYNQNTGIPDELKFPNLIQSTRGKLDWR